MNSLEFRKIQADLAIENLQYAYEAKSGNKRLIYLMDLLNQDPKFSWDDLNDEFEEWDSLCDDVMELMEGRV